MKLATHTLASLLVIMLVSVSSSSLVSATSPANFRQREVKLEKIAQKHDRKLELRASVIGVTPDKLKQEIKTSSFDAVAKKYGFKTRSDFNTALVGKIKDELKNRGWSDGKIQKHVDKRLQRIEKKIQ